MYYSLVRQTLSEPRVYLDQLNENVLQYIHTIKSMQAAACLLYADNTDS